MPPEIAIQRDFRESACRFTEARSLFCTLMIVRGQMESHQFKRQRIRAYYNIIEIAAKIMKIVVTFPRLSLSI